jgi:hypothetical protein
MLRMFGPKREEKSRGRRKLDDDVIHKLGSSNQKELWVDVIKLRVLYTK